MKRRENLEHYYSFRMALINIHSILIRMWLRLTFIASSISGIKILFRSEAGCDACFTHYLAHRRVTSALRVA